MEFKSLGGGQGILQESQLINEDYPRLELSLKGTDCHIAVNMSMTHNPISRNPCFCYANPDLLIQH